VSAPPRSGRVDGDLRERRGSKGYAEAVSRVKAYVRDGDTFQANVSQRLRAPAAVHPVEAYDALRAVNPAPYSGLIEFSREGAGRGRRQ